MKKLHTLTLVILLTGFFLLTATETTFARTENNKLPSNLIVINSPRENSTISNSILPIQGQSPANTTVTLRLNNKVIDKWVIGPSELFIKQVALVEGENLINFIAVNNEGESQELSLTVNYSKEVPRFKELDIPIVKEQPTRDDVEHGIFKRFIKGFFNLIGRN